MPKPRLGSWPGPYTFDGRNSTAVPPYCMAHAFRKCSAAALPAPWYERGRKGSFSCAGRPRSPYRVPPEDRNSTRHAGASCNASIIASVVRRLPSSCGCAALLPGVLDDAAWMIARQRGSHCANCARSSQLAATLLMPGCSNRAGVRVAAMTGMPALARRSARRRPMKPPAPSRKTALLIRCRFPSVHDTHRHSERRNHPMSRYRHAFGHGHAGPACD